MFVFPTGQRKLGIVLICAIGLLAASVRAGTVTILNPGFESPDISPSPYTNSAPADWELSGSGGGQWNINDHPLQNSNGDPFWTDVAPDGKQVGWLAPANELNNPASFSQLLTDALLANTLYTLSGWVGHPLGFGGTTSTAYTVELLAGANVLGSISGTGPETKFTQFNLIFDSTGSAFIGQTLTIRLSTNQAQTAFDAISLTTTALAVSPVPLPAAAWMGLSLMALALPVGLKRRFQRAMDI